MVDTSELRLEFLHLYVYATEKHGAWENFRDPASSTWFQNCTREKDWALVTQFCPNAEI